MDDENKNTIKRSDIEDYIRSGKQNAYDQKLASIINNTPADQDPLIYWHQVALDAIDNADRERKRTEDIRAENDNLKRYQANESNRIKRELQAQTMPSIRELLHRVQDGDFSMNIQLSFYPNTERKEKDYYAEEE